MICLSSGKDHGLAKTARQAARVFVLLFALAAATQSSLGTPPLEQTRFDRVTCFLDEIHHPQAGKIAPATVFIAAVWPDGTLASEGTGFVVSDSADGGAQGSRIVTAAHVIDDTDTTRNGQRLVVFFSDGMPLGVPRTVLRGATRELSVGGFNLVENDIAVIEIASFNDYPARNRFLGLQGLPLYGGADILVGDTGQSLGVSWGFSGAAAIDPAGRAVGVLTGADFRDRTTLELGSILDFNRSGGAVSRGPPALAAGNAAAHRVTLAGGERPLGDVVSLPTTVPNRDSFNKVWAWIARLPEQYHAIIWRMASAVLVQMDGFLLSPPRPRLDLNGLQKPRQIC
jgi:hypothetical protein